MPFHSQQTPIQNHTLATQHFTTPRISRSKFLDSPEKRRTSTVILKPFGIPTETHMKTIGDEKVQKLQHISESITQGDKFWKLFTENISDLDEEKFNRRAAWKIWRETSSALAEHVMHM